VDWWRREGSCEEGVVVKRALIRRSHRDMNVDNAVWVVVLCWWLGHDGITQSNKHCVREEPCAWPVGVGAPCEPKAFQCEGVSNVGKIKRTTSTMSRCVGTREARNHNEVVVRLQARR
jgi:hypothetical protein